VIDPRENKGDFADICRIGADALGGGNPMLLTILEKDYWVTRVLCAIAEQHSDHVVFKGGTSLSKGLGLTERFSEDIDLVVDVGDRGEGSRDKLLKAIAQDVANSCALEMTLQRSGKGEHRDVAYSFEAIWAGGEAVKPSVLLEMGIRSALVPATLQPLKTMIAAAVPRVESELPSCELSVLGADRTLVEKLCVIHGTVVRYLANREQQSLNRIGRHYYDVAKLLAAPTVNASIGTSSFWEMAKDADVRGARDFAKRHVSLTELNCAESHGLFPDDDVAQVLRREYHRDEVLFFGAAPSFDDALLALESIRPRLRK
jgi:hypothetical protein